METIERKSIHSRTKERKWEISERVIHLINQTIKNPWDNFADRINYIIQKAINVTKQQWDVVDEECQKKVFNEVYLFLNGLFKECQIKKFYNNIPSINIQQFWEKSLWEQFINNIYGKERKLFYRDELKWWSCHHWTILLKNLFDTLKDNGLQIENRIVAYDGISWHSAILIKFQWKEYIADIHGFNESSKKIINSVEELNKIYNTKEFSKFSFQRKYDKNKYYFDTITEFSEYINNRKQVTATIEFKPKIENNEEVEIKMEFGKWYISLILNGKIYKYRVDNFRIDKNYKNPYDAIEYLLKNIHWSKEHKQELGKYLNMIVSKVNREKIYTIYKEE